VIHAMIEEGSDCDAGDRLPPPPRRSATPRGTRPRVAVPGPRAPG
jgi:hypothetical protein